MALNIFKKNTEKETVIAGKVKKSAAKKAEEKKTEAKKEAKVVKNDSKKREAKKGGYAIGTIKSPYITEKAVNLTDKDIYVFRVDNDANKTAVKKAVEEIYKVDVEKVTMINTKGKKIGRGRMAGIKKGFRKALIKIKKGQKIEVMPK
ncbi:MAG: 50S ribosomal protein L23 [Candidatus Paceibacterota bacterium]|jgi:large subunit ribosomal protein L23